MTEDSPEQKDPDRAQTVTTWGARARRYGALVRAQPVFARLADGLLQYFEGAGAADALLDVGAGTGLVGERWLDRCGPDAARTLFVAEPAEEMLAVARERLCARGVPAEHFCLAAAEELGGLDARIGRAPFDLATSSAALQLCDLPSALRAIAKVLRPGGRLAFNLWWHRIADDVDRHKPDAHWKAALARSLAEHDEPPDLARGPRRTAMHAPVVVSDLIEIARGAGLREVASRRIETDVPSTFFLDFERLDDDFLPEIDADLRDSIAARACELAPECTVGWREFSFEREAETGR